MAESEAATQSNIRVLATSKALKIEPFRIPDDHLKVGELGKNGLKISRTKLHTLK